MFVRRISYTTTVQALLLVCLAAVLPACDEAASQEDSPEGTAAGFEAVITGAYEGRVSGPGVLKLLPEAGFDRQGYFFLADAQGLRPHGVTFVLPRGSGPGRHTLESPSALDIGTVPSVRVDRDLGQATVSAGKKTSGFLELTAFPADETSSSGSEVAGRFDFETEDAQGRRIRVTGSFSFTAE